MMRTRPLEPIGAEIEGLDLARLGAPGASGFAQLHEAVLEHGLVVARDQQLDMQQQVALGRRFGPIEGQEYALGSPNPDVIRIANTNLEGEIVSKDNLAMRAIRINESWHTDSSFREIPASVSIFHAITVPPEGGDTFFASLRLGWEELDAATQRELIGRRAIHDYAESYRRVDGEIPGVPRSSLQRITHPMARVHPETRKPGLYVSQHAYAVEGMSESEGRAWIEKLVAWCTREGRVYRHQWRVGDLVLWDNRCMLHRAQGFDERYARVMHHVRVAGNAPAEAFAP